MISSISTKIKIHIDPFESAVNEALSLLIIISILASSLNDLDLC